MRALLLVLGCHRSGTSATAGALHALGYDLGPEGRLMPPSPANPRGYFESLDVVAAHDALLASFGCAWDRPPEDSIRSPEAERQLVRLLSRYTGEVAVVKDPRLCLVDWTLWADVAQTCNRELSVLSVTRDMASTCRSLMRRDGMDAVDAARLVARYERASVAWVDAVPMVHVSYEALLRDYKAALYPALEALHLPTDYPQHAEAKAAAFLDQGLNHGRS